MPHFCCDPRCQRGTKPFVMSNLKTKAGLDDVVAFIERKGMLAA